MKRSFFTQVAACLLVLVAGSSALAQSSNQTQTGGIVTLIAITGGLLSGALVYALAWKRGTDPVRLQPGMGAQHVTHGDERGHGACLPSL